MDRGDLPDFGALAEDNGVADAQAQTAKLVLLQERIGKGAKYVVDRPGRHRILHSGVLSERVVGPKGALSLAQRELVLFNDTIAGFAFGKGGLLSPAWEVPLEGVCVHDRLSTHDSLAFNLLAAGSHNPITLEATDSTSKLAWWASLASALTDASPSHIKMEPGWLHRGVVRGTLWSAAIEGDTAAARELVRYTLAGRARKLDTFLPRVAIGAVTGVALGPGGSVTLPPQPVTDIDAADDDGATALHYATVRGDREMVELLLEAGASPQTVNSDFDTPLHVACAKGDPEMVSLLVSNEAPVSMRNLLEQTPLSVALQAPALCGDLSALSRVSGLLLHYGAEASAPDSDGWLPLHRVALLTGTRGDDREASAALSELVSAFVRGGCDSTARVSVQTRDIEGSEGGAEDYTALHLACGAPVASVHLHSSSPTDDDEEDEDDGPVHANAPRAVDVGLIAALAENGCPVNGRTGKGGQTPLHLLMQSLSAPAAAPSPEQHAVRLSAVQRLVSLGARCDIPDAAGVTAGQLAATVPGLSATSALEALSQACAHKDAPEGALAVGDRVARALPKLSRPTVAVASAPTPKAATGFGKMFGALSMSKRGTAAAGPSAPADASHADSCCSICAARFSLTARKNACKRCRATVCGACSTKVFPLTAALAASATAASGDVDSDEDEPAPAASNGGINTQQLKMQAASKFAAGLSAISSVLAPPAASSGGGGPKTTGSGGTAGRGMEGAILALAAGQRVCDPCFLLLCSATAKAQEEARTFEIQKAAAMSKSVNFSDFAGAPSASLPQPSPSASASSSGSASGPRRAAVGAGAAGASGSGDAARQRAALLGSGAASKPPTPQAPASRQAQVGAQSGALQSQLAETQERLAQRGERLNRLQDRAAAMSDDAQQFASLAEQLKKKAKWGFF